MSKERRKLAKCLNCGHSLRAKQNYCPQCGQENTDKRVSLKKLINDFIGDFFEFDSKFIRSILPLILKPGFLTNKYNSGMRVRYITPIRLYIFITIIYFFFSSLNLSKKTLDEDLFTYEKKSITGDTIQQIDTVRSKFTVGQYDMDDLEKLLEDENFNEEVLLDSIQLEKNWFTLMMAKQSLKIAKKRGEGFWTDLVENISIMMFFLLPLFALLLKIIYIRRSKFYIEHLIFSLHLHSFTFLMLFLSLIAYIIFSKSFLLYLLLILFVYALLAFKKVYEQRWFKTVLKMFLLFLGYSLTMLIFLIATMLVTFLLF